MKKLLIISFLAVLVMFVCINSFSTVEALGQEVTAYRGQTIILSAILKDDLGNPIPNETIYFYDETNDKYLGDAVTDENGIAETLWSIPKNYTLGLLTLNATFRGDPERGLKPSYQSFELVLKAKTYISVLVTDTTLDPDDYTVAPGDEVTVNVTITDDVGQPVESINVSLIEGGKIVDQQFSNKNGKVTLRYILPLKISTDQIELLVQAGPYQYYDKSEYYITLYVRKVKTNMTILKVEPEVVYRNQSVTVVGRLVDEEENPLINAAIYVKLEERNISSTWTNASGFFETIFHIPNSVKPGKYVYIVLFAGSTKYEKSEKNVTLTIKSNTTIYFESKNATVIHGEIAKINVTLLDDQNQPVSFKELLVFYEQDHLLTRVRTDKNGYATIQWYVFQSKGSKHITVVFLGDEFYNSITLKIPILVFEQPLLVVNKENNTTLVVRNMQISVSIRLNSPQNKPLQNQLVHAYDITNHMYIGNVTTDGFGRAKFTYIVPNNAVLGQLIIKVIYLGNLEDYFLPVEKYVIYTVVEKIPTRVILNAPDQAKAGETITCIVILQTIENLPITSGKVLVCLNDSLLTIVETDEAGKAVIKIKIPSNASIIVVSLKYNGSEFYETSTYSVEIKIVTTRSSISFLKNALKIICTTCLLGIFVAIRRWKSSNRTIYI
ncbi:MAG: hypothetical protein ACTSXW_04170 [Candidatus Baldrarchaeia archaeon]